MDQASSSFRGLTSMTSTVIPGGARIIPHILLNRGWRDSLQRLYSLSQAHCKQVVEPGFKPRLSGPTLCLRMCLMGTSPRNGDPTGSFDCCPFLCVCLPSVALTMLQ